MINQNLKNKIHYALVNDEQYIDNSLKKEDINMVFKYLEENRIILLWDKIIKSSTTEKLDNENFKKYIANNLKKYQINFLKHIDEIFRISKKLTQENIEHVFLKGSALRISNYAKPFLRYTRDIDILVHPHKINEAYIAMKDIGFKYYNSRCNDSTDGSLDFSRHLPKMVNSNNIVLEIHHRVTCPKEYEGCILSSLMVKNVNKIEYENYHINIPRIEYMFAHLVYHAINQKIHDITPQFLCDIKTIHDEDGITDNKYEESLNLIYSKEKSAEIISSIKYLFNEKPFINFSMKKNKINYICDLYKKLINTKSQISYELQISKKNIKLINIFFYLFKKFRKSLGPK